MNLITLLRQEGIHSEIVLDALKRVPRENFVLKKYRSLAYENIPLPIGYGQTLSQPFTLAFMLQALDMKNTDIVLEVGTGSGCNAACLATIASKGQVFTIEKVHGLFKNAKRALRNYPNVTVVEGDGSYGIASHQFDKIIVTASANELKPAWITQLKEGGIILCPVGTTMIKGQKRNGILQEQSIGKFVFVPLT